MSIFWFISKFFIHFATPVKFLIKTEVFTIHYLNILPLCKLLWSLYLFWFLCKRKRYPPQNCEELLKITYKYISIYTQHQWTFLSSLSKCYKYIYICITKLSMLSRFYYSQNNFYLWQIVHKHDCSYTKFRLAKN